MSLGRAVGNLIFGSLGKEDDLDGQAEEVDSAVWIRSYGFWAFGVGGVWCLGVGGVWEFYGGYLLPVT